MFGMQEVYNSKDYDSGSPRHPVVYLASLAKEPVEVTITAPVANNPFTVSLLVLLLFLFFFSSSSFSSSSSFFFFFFFFFFFLPGRP